MSEHHRIENAQWDGIEDALYGDGPTSTDPDYLEAYNEAMNELAAEELQKLLTPSLN